MKEKRLRSQRWWLEAEGSGKVTIKMKTDDSGSYISATKTASLIPSPSDLEIVKKMVTWDKHALNFMPEISATNHFALLGFENFLFKKGLG